MQRPEPSTPDVLFWIGVASRDHLRAALTGGFVQLSRGKHAPVKRPSPGGLDSNEFAPHDDNRRRTTACVYRDRLCCRRVTVGGRANAGFRPLRRNATYHIARESPIGPLLESLRFLDDAPNWGIAFRRPVFAISKVDFEMIADGMGIDIGAG